MIKCYLTLYGYSTYLYKFDIDKEQYYVRLIHLDVFKDFYPQLSFLLLMNNEIITNIKITDDIFNDSRLNCQIDGPHDLGEQVFKQSIEYHEIVDFEYEL